MKLHKILRWIACAALFLIPIFPLLVDNALFFPFITSKGFYFRILTEVALASWVILAFIDARYRPKFTPLTITITAFAVITLLADIFGVSPLRSIFSNFERMEGWLVIGHLWAFYIVASTIFGSGEEGKRMWHRWFNVSLAVAVIVLLYAFGQSFGWFAIHQGSIRLDASLGNAAYLAVYMLIHVGIAAYMFFVARARQIIYASFLQWAYLILAVLFAYIVIQTQTRGTILGLIVGLLLALTLYALCGGKAAKKSRLISLGAIFLVVILGIIFWTNREASFIKNSPSLNRIATISWHDTKTQGRAYVWPMAIKGFTQRPILGWGQENFNYIFNANYNPKMWNQEQWFDRAHSVFLDWLVASGAVGLLAYLALYVLFLMSIWKSSLSVAEKSVLTGLVAGYAVHNIFVFDNIASYVSFFALLGFAGTVSLRKPRVMKAATSPRTYSPDAVEYVVMPIVVVALVAALYFLNVRPMQANVRLIAALRSCSDSKGGADQGTFKAALEVGSLIGDQEIREQLISCTSAILGSSYPGPVKRAYYDLTLEEIKNQIVESPGDARMYVIGGSFLNNAGQYAEAEPILAKAHELTPRKQAVGVELATLYLNTGRFAEGVELLKQAYELEPSYTEVCTAYIVGLILAGREAEARTLAGTDTSLLETERVARAYLSAKQYQKAIDLYRKLILRDPQNLQLRAQLAQTQHMAGMTNAAIATLRSISADYPEYKSQVEEAVKQLQVKP